MTIRAKISLLSCFFLACLAGAVVTAYLQMVADENVKPSVLYTVVQRQLGNLHGGDFAGAYEDASEGIQSRYSVDQFAAMVQTDFSEMTHVSRAEYGAVETRGHRATMQVYLIGENGETIPCVYMMVREGESWRIDGARLMRPWPANVRMEGTLL